MRIIDWAFSDKKYEKQKDNEIFIQDTDQLLTEYKKQNKFSFKKYALVSILFASLLFVPVIKNKTRNLQKEINSLESSIEVLNSNFRHARLDNEIITSSENISKLAKEHLSIELISYKKSQIKNNIEDAKDISKKKIKTKKNKNIKKLVKTKIEKKIKRKKDEIKKLQKLYSEPKEIPNEAKTLLARKISDAQDDLQVLYNSPKDFVTLERAQKWGVVQVVKAFLGMPIIPGR